MVLCRDQKMVLEMVHYLPCAQVVNLIEDQAPGELLPSKIEQFVVTLCFFPARVPQLHTPLDHGGIVTRHHYVSVLQKLLVFLGVQKSQLLGLFFLLSS